MPMGSNYGSDGREFADADHQRRPEPAPDHSVVYATAPEGEVSVEGVDVALAELGGRPARPDGGGQTTIADWGGGDA
jgi:hypothetical protein